MKSTIVFMISKSASFRYFKKLTISRLRHFFHFIDYIKKKRFQIISSLSHKTINLSNGTKSKVIILTNKIRRREILATAATFRDNCRAALSLLFKMIIKNSESLKISQILTNPFEFWILAVILRTLTPVSVRMVNADQ